MLPIFWERDASRGVLMWFTIASWKILNFVNLNSNMIELKMSVSRWTNLRRKISPIIWRKQSTVDTERIDGSLSISPETLQNHGKTFWLQRCVDHIKPSTPRIWRTTTQASAILEVSIMAPIIEFFLQLVAMERFLVELMIIQRKSTNELTCKATW